MLLTLLHVHKLQFIPNELHFSCSWHGLFRSLFVSECLFNKVVGFLSHFEEHLWTTASVANTFPEFYNYLFERAKILFCYYLCWNLQLATLLKMESIIGGFFLENLLLMNKWIVASCNPSTWKQPSRDR